MKCSVCGAKRGTPRRRRCDVQGGRVYVIGSLSSGRTLWGCRNCSWTHENDGEEVEHVCGSPKITRLGDRVKLALDSAGVTQDRVDAFLHEHGLPGCGGCGKRQEWLNNLDKKLGLGEKIASFQQAMGWTPREAKDGQSARTKK